MSLERLHAGETRAATASFKANACPTFGPLWLPKLEDEQVALFIIPVSWSSDFSRPRDSAIRLLLLLNLLSLHRVVL